MSISFFLLCSYYKILEGVMPKNPLIKKTLVIGSGPIIIGQAAEFDYAGTQACRALKEEGIEVVLLNSNPATIMIDTRIADKIYIEPMTVKVLEKIIIKERPDSILPTLGGQTGLNLAMELAESGFLDQHHVTMLGANIDAIKKAEDRQTFKDTMESINEPCIKSKVVGLVEDALEFAEEIGYPVIVRPAYTLGGSGGGIAETREQLIEIATTGLRLSRVTQALIEKCISGWKEIEYEVVRDGKGNVITICNMENIDPVGVHTGDSIVVAPSQTLSDKEYQMLRSAALNIITAMGIEGGCNVQFALHTESMEYAVIEVNPRVSRSSALASKATGYPIAKVSAKIAIGYSLDEITNAVTGKTYACFEPSLDYVVVKLPKFPFDKFVSARRTLGTQMQATGEVMAISNSFSSALLKAVRSLEINMHSLEKVIYSDMTDEQLHDKLKTPHDELLFALTAALRRGMDIELLHNTTKVDRYFLSQLKTIVATEEWLKTTSFDSIDDERLREIKQLGFPDKIIGELTGNSEDYISASRKARGIRAVYKMVDTCAAEFEAQTPYFYSTYDEHCEANPKPGKKVIVFGSGPIRIGQGIEFDFCSVHCIWALKELGYQTIIINNNPETVSTDFDTADRLYFEPLTPEDVESIIDIEQPDGVFVQFGGQTAIKLANFMKQRGIKVYGTQPDDIEAAEDRELFEKILEKLNILRPAGKTFTKITDGIRLANELGYPVIIRPSFVLGGQGMEIAYTDEDLDKFFDIISLIKQDYPILIDKYLPGKELEVDAICDGESILVPGIMEHIERAGVHSGDSISVYPTQSVSIEVKQKIYSITRKLAKELNIVGLINIQFVYYDDEVYIIEANPRSSRTVPYISKVTGIPMIELATKVCMGHKLSEFSYGTGLYPEPDYVSVKVPVFSFEKLHGVDTALGPEMKSTGEALGIGKNFPEALFKGLLGAGMKVPDIDKGILMTVKDSDKPELVAIAEGYQELGYKLFATTKTAGRLNRRLVPTIPVRKISEAHPNILDLIESGDIGMIINTPSRGRQPLNDGFQIRRKAVELSLTCLTSLDTARVLLYCLQNRMLNKSLPIYDLAELMNVEE